MGVSFSTLRSTLQDSRARLFGAIRGLSEEQFRFAPDGEAWPIAAHLVHLHRVERLYTERAREALNEDVPFVPSTRVHNDDDPGLAQHLAVPQIIHGMLNTRRELEALIEECDAAMLERAINHETIGAMTIEQIAVKMAGHELEHAGAIAALVKQAPASARVIIPLAQRS